VQAIEFVGKLKTTGLPSGNTIALAAAIRAFGPYASTAAERRESDPLSSTRAVLCWL
jgi:uncharacterized protein YoaH (UPF0181 family)